MKNATLFSLLLSFSAFIAVSCVKEQFEKIFFKSIASGYFFGNGKEEVVYPGHIIQNSEEFEAYRKKIDAVNPTSQELLAEPLNFEQYFYVLLADSLREGYNAAIEMKHVDVVNHKLRIFYKITTQEEKSTAVIRQAYHFLKVEKQQFDTYYFERVE